MILLHKLNNTPFYLNYRHIECYEAMPDTIITLTNEKKYLVKETPEEITHLVQEYHRKIFDINFQESVDI
jgi:flagellar protein FlbD